MNDEPEYMNDLVQRQIAEQGQLDVRIVKALFLGGPGVGKTTTLKRLLGDIINLATSGPSPSTGIDPPKTINLHHDLYKECAKMSAMLFAEDWKSLTIEEETGMMLHWLTYHPVQPRSSIPQPQSIPQSRSSIPQSQPSNESQSLLTQSSTTSFGTNATGSQSTPRSFNADVYSEQFKELDELIANSNWKEVRQRMQGMSEATILHIIDIGGQPEFFDIVPLILRGPSLCLIFLSLVQSLNDYFNVEYRTKHASSGMIKYTSSYNPLQMVHQVLASLQSLNDSEQQSAACLIATHCDQVSKESIAKAEEVIKTSLENLSFFKKDVLRHFDDEYGEKHEVFSLDNQNGDEKEIKFLRTELAKIIKNYFKQEPLPTSWGLFHLQLRYIYEEKGLCTLQQANALARRCRIDVQEVPDVLKFFHERFGTVFYFGGVPALKDLVICDPNLVFHPITKLVAESFGANPLMPMQAEQIRKTGEIPQKFFEDICSIDDKMKKVNAKTIVELLKSLHIITEIQHNGSSLFMSCLLRPYELDKLKKIDATMNPSPLLFTFDPSGYQPVGLFHALLGFLLTLRKKFSLHKQRYRNRVTLFFGDVNVEIFSTPSNLEIRVTKADKEKCLEVKKLLSDQIHAIMKEMQHMKSNELGIAFYCPKSLTSGPLSSPHIAKYEMLTAEVSPRAILRCYEDECEDHLLPIELEDKHNIWFEQFDHSEIKTPLASCGIKIEIAGTTLPSSSTIQTTGDHSIVSLSLLPVDDKILQASDIVAVLRLIIEIADWISLGLVLGIPDHELDIIKHDGYCEIDRRWKMVSMWLHNGTASWKCLVEALLDPLVNRVDIANRISQQHPLIQ